MVFQIQNTVSEHKYILKRIFKRTLCYGYITEWISPRSYLNFWSENEKSHITVFHLILLISSLSLSYFASIYLANWFILRACPLANRRVPSQLHIAHTTYILHTYDILSSQLRTRIHENNKNCWSNMCYGICNFSVFVVW